MGKYLERTDGEKAASKLEGWEINSAKDLYSHNNFAERGFAVVKAMAKQFPSMSLSTITAVSHARLNGTFQEGSTAEAADPRLAKALSVLCCIRRRTRGKITTLMREWKAEDTSKAERRHAEMREFQMCERTRLAAERARKHDEFVQISLAPSVEALRLQVDAFEGKKGAIIKYLKGQVNGRVVGKKREYPLSLIGPELRQKNKPMKTLMKVPGRDEIEHLQSIVELMIGHDAGEGCSVVSEEESDFPIVRLLPVISATHTSAAITAMKQEQARIEANKAAPKDDQLLLELREEYIGKILLDDDVVPAQLYKVVDVTYGQLSGPPYWEATCIPVEKGSGGSYFVPREHILESAGVETFRPKSLWGCVLVSFAGGEPQRMPYVDEYIAAFRRLECRAE